MEPVTNTLENKIKYLSQFWDQKVLSVNQEGYLSTLMHAWSYDFLPNQKLNWTANLRSLHAISEQEAMIVAEMLGHKVYAGTKFIQNMIDGAFMHQSLEVIIKIIDYLRSIGIALPWKGVPVLTLQEWGWLTLID